MAREFLRQGQASHNEIDACEEAYSSSDDVAWELADRLYDSIDGRSIARRIKAYRELDLRLTGLAHRMVRARLCEVGREVNV